MLYNPKYIFNEVFKTFTKSKIKVLKVRELMRVFLSLLSV